MNFDIREFYTETITHAPREVFGLYSNRVGSSTLPSLYDAPVFFNMYPSFDFVNDNPHLPNKPANRETVYFKNIESIESNIGGLLLLDENRNIVANIGPRQKITNLAPGNKFYIALNGISGTVTGAPNVKIVFNHYAYEPTLSYNGNIEESNLELLEDE